jgi:hypothetical protein
MNIKILKWPAVILLFSIVPHALIRLHTPGLVHLQSVVHNNLIPLDISHCLVFMISLFWNSQNLSERDFGDITLVLEWVCVTDRLIGRRLLAKLVPYSSLADYKPWSLVFCFFYEYVWRELLMEGELFCELCIV